MTHFEDGGSAFPQAPTNSEGPDQWGFTWHRGAESGMSLRDWFAGQALTGLLAANATYEFRTDNRVGIADDAYAHADAMLSARKKGPSDE